MKKFLGNCLHGNSTKISNQPKFGHGRIRKLRMNSCSLNAHLEPRKYAQLYSGRSSSQETLPPVTDSIAKQLDMFGEETSLPHLCTDTGDTPSAAASLLALPCFIERYSESFIDQILTHELILGKNNVTPVGIPIGVNQCSNSQMDIFETRRKKLRQIIEEDFGGNQSAFSRHTGIKPPQVNRWLSDTAEKKPVINELSARDIERKCGKPMDWLDHESPLPLLSHQAIKVAELISSLPPIQQAMIINLVESTIEMQRQAQLALKVSTDDRPEK